MLVLVIGCMLGSAPAAYPQWTTNGNGDMSNTNTGNVGIGTTAPGAPLTVIAPNGVRSGIVLGGQGNTWVYIDLALVPIGTIATGKPIDFIWSLRKDAFFGGDSSGPSMVLNMDRQGGGLYAPLIINPNGNVILAGAANATNGNVGVGTNAPGYKLDVAGAVRSSTGGFVFPDGTTQTTAAVSGGGGTISGVTAGSGLTGGGTTGAVTLTNDDKGSSQFIFKNIANAAGATQFSATSNTDGVRFAGAGGTTVTFDAALHKITIDGSTSTVSSANISAGQFGAGSYTFPSNVTVVGTLEGGNIKAKYQDMAEWVESSQDLQAGTVVVLDTDRSNQVIASTEAYDSRVAGVISQQPGIALGEERAGRVLVATTGRVKVKADATNGPIKIGDLLVTSDKVGFAMKSLPMEVNGRRIHLPGTLIGKALEPLNAGTGEILVLLSLQ